MAIEQKVDRSRQAILLYIAANAFAAACLDFDLEQLKQCQLEQNQLWRFLKDSTPRGNCNPHLENGCLQTGRLQTGHLQTGYIETPRFQCSELQRLDQTHFRHSRLM